MLAAAAVGDVERYHPEWFPKYQGAAMEEMERVCNTLCVILPTCGSIDEAYKKVGASASKEGELDADVVIIGEVKVSYINTTVKTSSQPSNV